MLHRPLTALGLALAVAGLGACGSSGTDTAATVRAAGTKTLAQRTVQLNLTLTNPSVAPKPTTGAAGFDLAADAGRYTSLVVYGVPGVTDGDQIQALLHLPNIYVPLTGAAAKLKSTLSITTPWLALDLRVVANLPGLSLGTIAEANAADPRQFLLFLAGASKPVTKVGSETIAGTSTTHYRLVCDVNTAVQGLSGSDATTLNRDAASYTSPLVPVDVWIDAGGLVRQLQVKLSVKEVGGKPPTNETVAYTFTGFGAPVDTNPPPTSQSTDVSGVLKSLAGAATGG